MDEKNIINALNLAKAHIGYAIDKIALEECNTVIQKSKKTGKKKETNNCLLKGNYSVHKYGCSGTAWDAECLECEFRR